MRLISFSAVFLAAALIHGATGQETLRSAAVSGHVFDAKGAPIKNAKVTVLPLEMATSGPIPSTLTNEQCEYHLVSFAYGQARICASAEDQGFPDTTGSLFQSPTNKLPEVQLSPGASVVDVDVYLTRGVTILLRVKDGKNAGPIASARIKFSATDARNEWYSTGTERNGTLRLVCRRAR